MADLSLGDILAQADSPAYVRVASARVLLRQDLVQRHAELEAELSASVSRDSDSIATKAPTIARQIAELQGEMEVAKVEFRFRNIGRKAWADLLAKHPPTKAHKDVKFDHNPETFPIAALAAACVAPSGSNEAAFEKLCDEVLTRSQFEVIWKACFDANAGGADVPKSLAAGAILRANERSASSASAAAEPSPAASSSAG